MKQKLGLLILYYLRFLARLQLKKYAPDIIGITGSAGKTSTRNAVAAVLEDKYNLKVSHKANSESGVPLDILGLSLTDYSWRDWLRVFLLAPVRLLFWWQPYDKYVVELGIDSPKPPKNMEYLLTVVKPRTGILLNALPVHSEAFDELVTETEPEARETQLRRLIAEEKGKLINSLPEKGLAIVNASDPAVFAVSESAKAPVKYFGWNETESLIPMKHLDVMIMEAFQSLHGTRFVYSIYGALVEVSFPTLLLPDHFAETFAAAFCVGLDEDYSPDEIAALLEKNFTMPAGRSTIIPGKKGSVIIDSSYNASAKPTIDALALLGKLNPGRAMAILGDMRELGNAAKVEHLKVATKAAEVCDRVLLVGPQMKQFALPLLQQHIKPKQVTWHKHATDAAETLLTELKVGDVVLVKGSQNTLFLEAAVELLMRHPEMADELLCRRGAYWQTQRQRAGVV